MQLVALTLLISLLVSCAKKDAEKHHDEPQRGDGDGAPAAPTEGSLSGIPFNIVQGSSLQLVDSGVQGDGKLIFRDTLGDAASRKRYTVSFSLADGGRLEMISHADDALENGVRLSFARKGSKVELSSEPNESAALGKEIAALDGATALTLEIEVHNDEVPAHATVRLPDAPEALWDSEANGAVALHGNGARWGLVLRGAVVTAIALADVVSGDHDGEDPAVPTAFTVAHLLQTARKATTRFERLGIRDSAFASVKTWKSPAYVWAKLTYTVPGTDGARAEQYLFLACHFHGSELGCHKKDASDASEPNDEPSDGDLPPIDDDLPLPDLVP